MNDFILSCCSTADLKKEHLEGRNISYVCFHYELAGVNYTDDLWQTMPPKDFYNAMAAGADTKTSQVNAIEYEEYFEPFLQQGKDVLHISLSSGISGSYNSANIAQAALQEKYPDRKIYIVDSLCASSGYGLLMDKLADLRDGGMNIDELYAWALENRLKLHHVVLTTDLTYFVRGGRVSKAAGLIGGMLNICPMIIVDANGKLTVRQKIRTKRKGLQTIVDQMELLAQNGLEYNDKCYICNSDCLDDASALASMIEKRFPKLNGKVLINDIGPTIGSHTGPGTSAIFFWGTEREISVES
jgi:DegV family protein with EDD domain